MNVKKKSLLLVPGPWTIIAVVSVYILYLLFTAILG